MAKIASLIEKGSRELQGLAGLTAVSVVSMAPSGDGWLLTAELLEREAVPDTMDVLGMYEAELDSDGSVIRFQRKGLRHRGDTEGE